MLENKGQIDKNVPIPLYFQLKELILGEIRAGRYVEGDVIPTEMELSEMFGLSRTTVRQATSELVQEGWLYKVKSKGTFVSHPKIKQDFIRKLESFNDSILARGFQPSTQVLDFRVIEEGKARSDVKQALGLGDDKKVIYVFRKRMADSLPVVTVHTFLPYDSCQRVLDHDLNQETLYSILGEEEKTRVFRVDREVQAVEANEEDVKFLGMKAGKPVLESMSIGYNAFSEPVEYSLARYRGDFSKFTVTLFPAEEAKQS